MKFKYLSEVGQNYQYEVGTTGLRNRMVVWQAIEAKLKQAIVDLKNLISTPTAAPAVPAPAKGVSALIRFHEAKQQQYAPQARIEEARRKVEFYRTWLKREGAAADADGNIDMSRFDQLTVTYDYEPWKQDMTKVRIVGGRLFIGDTGHKPLDTSQMVTHFSGPGNAIYVMEQTGNLHVASHVVGHYHHSSLLAGQRVGCAGELKVIAGSLVWLSNKSGHYTPDVAHLLQTLHLLQKRNVPMTFQLTVCSAAGSQRYGSVADFLKTLELNDEPDYELMKLMAYSRHLTDSVLNPNGWRWRQHSHEKPGVYEIATNNVVPHKTVRQWLKQTGRLAQNQVKSGYGR